ncbi:hypothetical protein [Shewanella sp. S23-S33]|uniref:hypothetical protein n=1 Tax=Shewanella sp. S23-S33 TaxID=3342769 RepID=UPI00372D7BED
MPITTYCILNRNIFAGDASSIHVDLVNKLDIATVRHTQKKPQGLMLIIGNHGVSKDSLHILGQQLPRVINNKTPYIAAFIDDGAKKSFNESIEIYKEMYPSELSSEQYRSLNVNEKIAYTLNQTAKKQINISLRDLNLSEFSKLYILGHGAAGLDVIKSGGKTFDVKQIVDTLEENNILSEIKDLRVTSCNSADKNSPKSMSSRDISEANEKPGFFSKMIFGDKKSLVELISEEVWIRGYTDISVSGYHGSGVFYNGKDLPLSHLRSSTIPVSDEIKRKEVRVTLHSNLDSNLDSDLDSDLD